jgi:glycosyltransferase involved in cell wall biosynthesis
MKICILSDEHYPHTGADTIVIINTAAALGAAGADVELITPRLWRGHESAEEIMDHYGVGPTFRLTRLPSWPPPERRLRLEKLAHGLAGPLYATLKRADVIHSRDLLPLLVAHAAGRPWSFETYRRHAEEKPWLPGITRRIGLGRAVGAVAHSRASADSLARMGFLPDAVLVARPGVAPDRFEPRLDPRAAREQLSLPAEGPLVVYVGNVGPSKGTDEITDLAARVPEARFLVVGGTDAAVEALRRDLGASGVTNVILAGHQPPGRVAPFLYAADVLYVPAIYHNAYAGSLAGLLRIRTLPGTPLKLYGYLAAGRPVVSADQPHTRDLLRHEETAVMVPPGDSEAAAAAIRRVLGDTALSRRLSENALSMSRELTWENRGKKMLAFFDQRLALMGGKS